MPRTDDGFALQFAVTEFPPGIVLHETAIETGDDLSKGIRFVQDDGRSVGDSPREPDVMELRCVKIESTDPIAIEHEAHPDIVRETDFAAVIPEAAFRMFARRVCGHGEYHYCGSDHPVEIVQP